MTFSILDIIALIIMIVAALRVTYRGFITELMTKAGLIVGLLIAVMFASVLAPVIDGQFQLGTWSNVVAFVVLFLFGYVIMRLLSSVLTGILDALHLSALDNLLGFALGVLEGAIIISLAVYLLKLQSFVDVSTLLTSSWIVELLEPIAPFGIELVKGEFKPSV